MPEQLVFYDIPTKAPRGPWSPNPWKTRLYLNFKGIDYRTEWVEYPDIKPTMEPHFTDNPPATYTLPAVKLPDGTHVMESYEIAKAIEARYPEPSARVDAPIVATLIPLMLQGFPNWAPMFFHRVPTRLLAEPSKSYFLRTREVRAGMPVDQYEKTNGGAVAIERASPVVRQITALLKEHEGPFFLGRDVSYADFIWGAFLKFCKTVGADDMYEEVMAMTGGERRVHDEFYAALQPYLQKVT